MRESNLVGSHSHPAQAVVLFEETFYNAQDESFTVACIDQPLSGGERVSSLDRAATSCLTMIAVDKATQLPPLNKLSDCRAFIFPDRNGIVLSIFGTGWTWLADAVSLLSDD